MLIFVSSLFLFNPHVFIIAAFLLIFLISFCWYVIMSCVRINSPLSKYYFLFFSIFIIILSWFEFSFLFLIIRKLGKKKFEQLNLTWSYLTGIKSAIKEKIDFLKIAEPTFQNTDSVLIWLEKNRFTDKPIITETVEIPIGKVLTLQDTFDESKKIWWYFRLLEHVTETCDSMNTVTLNFYFHVVNFR